MSNKLYVSLVQSHLHWENPAANRAHFSEVFKSIDSKPDLIILPEMFTTGFTMNANRLAETPDGESLNWMRNQAQKYEVAIVGSLIIKEDNHYYNRLYFVFPDGLYKSYDKRHTFTLARRT